MFFCTHPYDEERRLWFISDFPHLLKCFRNLIMQFSHFWTPDGIVKKSHWQALLKYEQHLKPNLKAAYKLTAEHIEPKGYQKMNVLLAYRLFDMRVSAAKELYKENPLCPELHDADPNIKLIKRVSTLIRAMTSRSVENSLTLDENNASKKAIQDFINYLKEWQEGAKLKKENFPLSQSTIVGLQVTLGATLEILKYLTNECLLLRVCYDCKTHSRCSREIVRHHEKCLRIQ